jgi:uncharacterized protein (UPF0276 family)
LARASSLYSVTNKNGGVAAIFIYLFNSNQQIIITMMLNGVGLGIRPELFSEVASHDHDLGFFEAHSENYFGHSIARHKLLELRQDFPVSLHGVGLSLGRSDDLNQAHLDNLKSLVDEVEPSLVSEHLAWSAYSHRHIPDLLPLPLSQQALDIMCQHVEQMQEALGRRVLVENPSNYLIFDQLQIPEPDFLNELAKRTGCGLLLDVNNVYVSSQNIGRDPRLYVEQLNTDAIQEYHLAGHTKVNRDGDEVLIDTHNQPLCPQVLELLSHTIAVHGVRPALLEWDSDFPRFAELLEQCDKVSDVLTQNGESISSESHKESNMIEAVVADKSNQKSIPLTQLQSAFIDELMQTARGQDGHGLQIQADFSKRLNVYRNNTFGALLDYLVEVYPATQGVLGDDYFRQLARLFVQTMPPSEGNVHLYGAGLGSFILTIQELQAYPYLYDLARYEWHYHELYYADNSGALNVGEFDQQALLETKVELHQAHILLKSDYPVFQIHRQSLPSYLGEVAIDLNQGSEYVLLRKVGWQVESLLCSEEQHTFLELCKKHDTLIKIIEAAQQSYSEQQIPELLSWFLSLGLLRSKHV